MMGDGVVTCYRCGRTFAVPGRKNTTPDRAPGYRPAGECNFCRTGKKTGARVFRSVVTMAGIEMSLPPSDR